MNAFLQRALDFIAGRSGYRETYVSEATRFMQEYLRSHPEEIYSQKEGRAIWWDKTPEERAPAPPMRHSPRAGGNEHTFEATGGYEWSFKDDEIPPPPK
jgi:Protein of unknown function (DUF3460)